MLHDGTTYLFCSIGAMECLRKEAEPLLTMDQSDRSM